ncbi:hypothetical protein HJG60_011673 [Phyllostomus discolor]|uniref:Uncharacterized protein n=1 Tax=Phyllostomus discolor TaxID=89673 RepID=A0A833ZN65_9CHIR|nr:hypothetical protein HJG60_011673 [Phyllostomus discolor]
MTVRTSSEHFGKPCPRHAAATPWKSPSQGHSGCDLIQSSHNEKGPIPGAVVRDHQWSGEGKTSHRPRHKTEGYDPKYPSHASNSTTKGNGQVEEQARDVTGHLAVKDTDGNQHVEGAPHHGHRGHANQNHGEMLVQTR